MATLDMNKIMNFGECEMALENSRELTTPAPPLSPFLFLTNEGSNDGSDDGLAEGPSDGRGLSMVEGAGLEWTLD